MGKSSELVRGAGMAASVWQKFEEGIRRNNGLLDDLHILAQPEGDTLIDTFTKQLVTAGAMQRNAYVVPVDYDLAHAQQIEGRAFDWITEYDNKLIRKNPTEHLVPMLSGEIEQRITLVHLDRYAKTEVVLAEMERLNVRPTLSAETLAFAKAHPDVQRQFPLIGLGSVWVDSDRDRRVLCLYKFSDERDLRLSWYDDEWHSHYRFLAVRK